MQIKRGTEKNQARAEEARGIEREKRKEKRSKKEKKKEKEKWQDEL